MFFNLHLDFNTLCKLYHSISNNSTFENFDQMHENIFTRVVGDKLCVINWMFGSFIIYQLLL